MDVTSKELMSMIHFGHGDPNIVAEVLDKNVKVIIGEISINDIANFVNDNDLHYNPYTNT